jgi:DHA1 family bicyclomycin/chloramphenicol resistance-like MFS transporter
MPIPSWLPALLGFLTAVGPLSTDMYLPAFPAIEASLGGRAGAAQVTLATWFLGLAIGQMTQGTLADRLGRRTPLLAGTALYTLASAGCALAPDLATLALMRGLAAFGGSASMVIPRAVVRDLADGHEAARLMSRLFLVMGAAPILAPTLGGFVLRLASWHAIFWIAAAYGAVCCALVWAALPETLPLARRSRIGAGGLLDRFAAILAERGFASHTLMLGSSGFALFAYLGGSPDAFIVRFGLAPSAFGILFGVCSAGFIAASQLNPRAVLWLGAGRVMRTAVRVALVAALGLVGLAAANVGPWWALAALVWVCMASMGFSNPNAMVGALSRHAAHAGSASALMGTLQYLLAAVSGLLVGLAADHTARPMAALMALGALGAATADLFRPRR